MLYYNYGIQQHHNQTYAMACSPCIHDSIMKGDIMTVKQLIKQLEQLDRNAECVFAEYDKQDGQTQLWYLNICCNWEHQAEQKQVWFSRDLLMD